MTDRNNRPGKIHQGRNIKRFREMLGVKQEALAHELGDDWSQKKISLLEQKEIVEDAILRQVSEILKIPVEAIQNFDEDSAINVIANTFNNHDHSSPQFANYINNSPNFNPIDKVVELFERLLTSEREKVELMREILNKINK